MSVPRHTPTPDSSALARGQSGELPRISYSFLPIGVCAPRSDTAARELPDAKREPRQRHVRGLVPAEPRSHAAELYVQASGLLFASERLRAAARAVDSAAAAGAALGCIEGSLEALRDTAAALRDQVADEAARAGATQAGPPEMPTREVRREMQTLVQALETARETSGRLRERIGPVLARLTLG